MKNMDFFKNIYDEQTKINPHFFYNLIANGILKRRSKNRCVFNCKLYRLGLVKKFDKGGIFNLLVDKDFIIKMSKRIIPEKELKGQLDYRKFKPKKK